MNIMEKAAELIEKRIPFAFATVIASKGSTPRSTASKMIVLEDKSIFDTIGGGIVEAKVIEEAVAAIREGKPRTVNYKLNNQVQDGLMMLCGGDMDIFIDVFVKVPHVIIVGGGHVGLAVSKSVQMLGWEFSVVEEREQYAGNNRFLGAREIYIYGDLEALDKIEMDKDTYVVIVTKDHDKETLRRVIKREIGYIGMIGSKRKVSIVMKELTEVGIETEFINKVYAPVGLDIGAETPEEIAVSIVAEMIMHRRGGSGKSLNNLR